MTVNTRANTQIMISGPQGRLETLIYHPSHRDQHKTMAIICHPDPLQQGTMHNKVVSTIANSCHDLGVMTIRFNYRGVGNSQGKYAYVTGETADLLAVIAWAKQHYPHNQLWLAGFSFGAYIAANVASQLSCKVTQLITIAPVVNRFDFASLPTIRCPWLVVQGKQDDIAQLPATLAWIKTVNPPPTLAIIANCGHFFHQRLLVLRQTLVEKLGKHVSKPSIDEIK